MVTLDELISAGALAQLCGRFHAFGGMPEHWPMVRLFALREFRDIDSVVIDQLIDAAKRASVCAAVFNRLAPGEILPEDCIPGTGEIVCQSVMKSNTT